MPNATIESATTSSSPTSNPTAQTAAATGASPGTGTATTPAGNGEPAPRWNPAQLTAHYDRYHQVAAVMSDKRAVQLRADANIILTNVTLGARAVATQVERVRKELPAVDIDALLELPQVAGALLYASSLVREPVSPRVIEEYVARVKPLRRELLNAADAFVRRGMMPGDRVQAIKDGTGLRDYALDAVALSRLYSEHWSSIEGKHVFTREELDELGANGDWLLANIVPTGGHTEKEAPAEVTPRQIRDRLNGLIIERHEELRRVAFYLWGADSDKRVPKLTSRVVTGRSPASDGGTTDAAGPTAGSPTSITTMAAGPATPSA